MGSNIPLCYGGSFALVNYAQPLHYYAMSGIAGKTLLLYAHYCGVFACAVRAVMAYNTDTDIETKTINTKPTKLTELMCDHPQCCIVLQHKKCFLFHSNLCSFYSFTYMFVL